MRISRDGVFSVVIKITYFLSIFLPIYSSNNIGSYIKLVGNFNIIHLLVIVSLLLCLMKRQSAKVTIDEFLILIYIAISISMGMVGYLNGYENVFTEIVWYVIPALFYFLIKELSEIEFSLLDFMDLTYYAMFGNCLFNLLMYLTRTWNVWGYSTFLGTKYGGNYYTVLCLTLPYGIHLLYNKNKRIHPLVIVLSTVLSVWCLIVAQSRSLLILALIPCVVLLFSSFNNRQSGGTVRKIIFMVALVSVLVFVLKQLLDDATGMGARLAQMQIFSDDDTFMIRVYAAFYNLKVFFSNVFGRGLGYPLFYYSSTGQATTQVYYLDNTYLTEAIRGGIFLVTILIWFVIRPIKSLRQSFKQTNDKVYTTILLSYLLFIINATLMSAQSIHGTAVSIAMWSFISVCINDNSSIIESTIEEGTREC